MIQLSKYFIGIYKITSPSGKVYIGQSVNIHKRWKAYKKLQCKAQLRLYNSLKKHGSEKHIFEILCQCLESELNNLEKYYVDLYQTFNSEFGLNLKDGGGSHVRLSEETKKNMSVAQKKHFTTDAGKRQIAKLIKLRKGIKVSKETLIKMSNARKGQKASAATKLNMSIAKKNMTEETKKKIGQGQIGKKRSQSTKDKISLIHKGKPKSKDQIEKFRNNNIGKKHSEETKLKMSLASKGKKKSEEHRKNISLCKKGKKLPKHTDEQRKNSSIAKTGIKRSEETKRKIGDAHRGKKHSEETKLKMSLRMKKVIAENNFFTEEHRNNLSEAAKKHWIKRKLTKQNLII